MDWPVISSRVLPYKASPGGLTQTIVPARSVIRTLSSAYRRTPVSAVFNQPLPTGLVSSPPTNPPPPCYVSSHRRTAHHPGTTTLRFLPEGPDEAIVRCIPRA